MPEVVRKDIDNLNAELTIVIAKADYEPKLKAGLRQKSKTVQMKGFRKGKTPMSYIKKVYGKAIIAEEVNKLIQQSLTDYITNNDLHLLGAPIPNAKQQPYDINLDDLQDIEFKFDIGLAPEFEVQHLEESTFPIYQVEIPTDIIDKEFESLRKRHSNRVEIDDDIRENDIVELNAKELDGDHLKPDGWATTFSVLVKDTSDQFRELVLSKKKGDTISFDIYQVEDNKEDDYVTKYLYGASNKEKLENVGTQFEATIQQVKRIELPELDTAFFDKVFGEGKVTNEVEARGKVEEELATYYNKQAEVFLSRDFKNVLLEKNILPLPNEFLKRWILVNNENLKGNLPEETYNNFAENMRWSLIQARLMKRYGIEVTNDNIFEYLKDTIRRYLQGQSGFEGQAGELVVLNTANRMMQDEKQVQSAYEELVADRLFKTIREKVNVEPNKISIETFENILIEEAEKQKQQEEEKPEPTPVEDVEEGIEEVTEDMD